MVNRMPDKYRRYSNGGGVMGLSQRVRKNIRRDVNRGGPDPKAEFKAKLEQRKTMRPESMLDRFIDPIVKTDRRMLDINEVMGDKMQRGRVDINEVMGDKMQRESPRGLESLLRVELQRKAGPRMARGGMIRGYQQGGIPANYAAPQAYGGYGMPAQFAQRQEHLSPEVAQQYADLTRGIMRAGTRRYDDVRYRGPQLAGFTGMEAAAQAGAGAYGRGAGPRGTLQAASTIGEAARGIGRMIPEQQALAAQFGAMAPQAQQQAQAAGTGIQQLAERAELQGRLAGAGMRQTGFGAQAEQQALGAGQAAYGTAGQAQMAGVRQDRLR